MPTQPLVDHENVRAQVDAVIEHHLHEARNAASTAYGADVSELFDAMERLLSGGKRLRAAFTYWSWRAHGGKPDSSVAKAVIEVGAALEFFQAAALFHDDLMDKSDTRRGSPTAHIHFAAMHRELSWPGDDAQFGLSAAVLLGDLSLVASEEIFADAIARIPAEHATATRKIFDLMRAEVTIGQYLDVLTQVRPWPDDPGQAEDSARAVIRAKSARYSVEHPISLGAALAGATDQQRRTCEEFGLPLGEAFQLRDDILGVFGDPGETGKPAGDDLTEGKRTVLLARTLYGATPADAATIRNQVGQPDLSMADIDALRKIIIDSGALAGIESLVSSLTETAFHTLEIAGLATPGKEMLHRLGLAATSRAS